MSDRPLTTSDVARELRISESSVRGLERSGRLPATRTATGIRLFDPADVRRMAEQRAQQRAGERRA